jgi:hypothetical protein
MPSSAPPPPLLGAAVTVKVALLAADEPTELEQLKLNVSVPAAEGVIVRLPLDASVPLQFPDAVQLVALIDDQEIVVELPTAIDVAAKVSVGAAGGAFTVNVTEFSGDGPIALAQVIE